MAPKKKASSKTARRDSSPDSTDRNTALQDAGIRLSPARTPKKLLRNKKRKELIESLSPSPKSSKKPKKSASTSKGQDKSSTSSGTPSILSFFAKAKPVQFVQCPVCSQQVAMTKINKHLDSECLATDNKNNNSAVTENDTEVESVPKGKKKGKSRSNKSPGRKLADLKVDQKDKRTRLKLKKKIESHALYQSAESISSESMVESQQESGSDLNNESSDVEIVPSGQAKKKVHRELFSDNNSTCSHNGEGRTLSKLSLKRNKNSGTQRSSDASNSSAKSINRASKKTNTATGDRSPYWQLHANSSDECKIVKCTPSKDNGLSPLKKLTQQFRNGRSCDENTSSDELNNRLSTASDCVTQRTSHSTSSSEHHGSSHKDETRTPKKLTPVFRISPAAKTTLSSKITNCSDVETSPGGLTPRKRKLSGANELKGDTASPKSQRHGSVIEKHTSVSASHSPKSKPHLASPSQRLSQQSSHNIATNSTPSKPHSNSSTKFDSPSRVGNSPGASTSSAFHTPTKSPMPLKSIYSPHRFKPSSPHRTPIHSPLKSSQAVSPAPSSTSSYGSPSKRDPYYVSNFKLIFLTVLGNADDKSLFSDEDLVFVDAFKNLSGPAQQLYVRLYQRKHAWLRVAKLDYPKIAVDLKPAVAELQAIQFLQGESQLTDLEEALNLLPAPDVKTLAKSLRVSSGSGQKSDLVAALLKHGKQQRSIFNINMKQVVMKKTRALLGSCIRLCKDPRTVFSRIMLLFSLAVNMDDEDQASGGQSQLQTLLMVNMGRVSYPMYKVFRTRRIFRCRDDLIRYEEANQYEQDISAAMTINDFELALQIQQAAEERFKTIQQDEEITGHDQSLPPFLRHFTASWLYTHLLFTGVEIHQKMRSYGDAVAGLRSLLDQTMYCMDSRGRWWDRLALNLEQHLKKPNEALDAILAALADPYVHIGHHLALQQRAQKIFKSQRNKKLLPRQEEFTFDDIREIPKVTIQGQVLPFQAPGVKNTFVRRVPSISGSPSSRGNDVDMAICNVEQVAIQHYKDMGFEEGVHGEASVFTTLIFLLFWDIVFMDGIPDVFSYPYQSAPLDIRYSSFYECRKYAIDEKLEELSNTDVSTLQGLLESGWKAHEGENCVGVSWELFTDVDHAKGLLACLGGQVLCAIASRILKNHRHTRAGMPDLTMWSTKSNKYKIVEVKGPGDRLSHKQILWIDYMLGLGVDVEVCHVQASSKRLHMN